MIPRASSMLVALAVSALGCLGTSDESSVGRVDAGDCPQFLGMRLVGIDETHGLMVVREWSANDDVDTLFVVVSSEPSAATRQLVVEADIRPVRLADDVADTTLRYVSIAAVAIRELAPLDDSLRVWRVRPSALDRIAGTRGDERVLKVRAAVHANGRSICATTADILPSM